jgi:hypothetical protein
MTAGQENQPTSQSCTTTTAAAATRPVPASLPPSAPEEPRLRQLSQEALYTVVLCDGKPGGIRDRLLLFPLHLRQAERQFEGLAASTPARVHPQPTRGQYVGTCVRANINQAYSHTAI